MKLRWLAILCALAVGVPACGDKAKDSKAEKEDEDDAKDKKKDKKKKDGDEKAASSGDASKEPGSATTAPKPVADDEPPPPPAPTEEPKAPLTNEQVQSFLKDDAAKMGPDQFESLLLAVGSCNIDRFGVDYQCPAKKALSDGYKHKVEDYKKHNQVALKHIRHPKPAVRYEAASAAENAAFGYDAKDDADKLYIDAVRAETDPIVLAHMVSTWYTGARKSARARKVLVRLLDHSDARVREQAANRLSDKDVAKEIEGHYDLFLAKVEKDSDERVRAQACSGLSATEKEDAIAVFQKYVEGADTPQELRDGCFDGLVASWVGIPYPKKPSKAGYELTLKILEKSDRTEKFPPWKGMSKLNQARTEFKDYDSSGKEWYAAAKDFYDKARLVKALNALAIDSKAGYMARSEALYTLKRLGEQKLLETIGTTIKGQSGHDAKSLSERADKLSKEKSEF
ncbi:MAG: HEAT repeat domain-containing protein [Polyangiaceae bacterium]|nr:HEAT repeat domain-containing protein [Polyangiaceae bacterium]